VVYSYPIILKFDSFEPVSNHLGNVLFLYPDLLKNKFMSDAASKPILKLTCWSWGL